MCDRLKEYMDAQIREINLYKWICSEKAGYDLGDWAVLEWIDRYAKTFREWWDLNEKD